MFEAKLVKAEPNDESGDTSIPMRGATVNFLATRQVLAGASGTSSPSREVADILGGGEGDDELGKAKIEKILRQSYFLRSDPKSLEPNML